MSNWCLVVPLHNFQLTLDQPISFAGGLTLSRLPAWVKQDKLTGMLGSPDHEHLTATSYAFMAEYEAQSLGDPDPTWKGEQPKSIQESKYDLAVLGNLSLWLVQPSSTCFTLVFHAPRFTEGWVVQRCERHSPLLCHPADEDAQPTEDEVQRASNLHNALSNLQRRNAIWTAVRSTWAALQMGMEEVRYLLLWIALEALFGPEDGREITFRLAQRIALFLGQDKAEAQNIYKRVKSGYSFRSQVAHGRWKSNSKSVELMADTESCVRQSLVRILSDPKLTKQFLDKSRESYLDELVFQS